MRLTQEKKLGSLVLLVRVYDIGPLCAQSTYKSPHYKFSNKNII